MNTSISKLETFVLTAALLVGGAALTATFAAPTVSVPPFVYTGRIVNYEGASYDSVAAKKAEIRARKDGKLIARSSIAALDGDTSANYTLVIPMSSDASATDVAQKGDKLTFEIDAGTGEFYTETNAFVAVGSPGRTATVNVRVAACTKVEGVADEYVNAIMTYIEDEGLTDEKYATYDPNADWDGDGVSNYDEYLAGTDPFNAKDAGLKIISWEAVPENANVMALTFLPGRNRAYSAIRRAPDSSDPFTVTPHQTSPIVNGTQHNYFITGNEDPTTRVLYLLKVGDASLYRLRLE